MTDIADAIKTIQDALLTDDEYRASWVANISMAIYDTCEMTGEEDHLWRNRCAETFLRYLTAGHPDDPTSINMEHLPGSMGIQGHPV